MKSKNFDNQTFQNEEYEEVEFVNCSFLETTFKKCKFIDCKFKGCRISALSPVDCYFSGVEFIGSKVEGVDWTKASQIQNITFKDCVLNYSNFDMLKLPKIDIVDSEAKEVTFSETDLREARLVGTDFEKAVFFKTNLTKADFSNAKNYWIDVTKNSVSGAKFSMPEAMNLLGPFKLKIE